MENEKVAVDEAVETVFRTKYTRIFKNCLD